MAKKISSVFRGSFTHTQGFGQNPANYARFGLKGHNGDDYGMPVGTPLYAPFNGKVVEVGEDGGGYGRYLKLWDPSQNLQIITAHMEARSVNQGQNISTGQQIGTSGNTGNSTGPHLHVAAGDTDGSGNRTNRGNGYDGWYSWLNLDRSGAPGSSGSSSGSSSSGEPPLIDEGGAPANPAIVAPRDREELYGVIPTIEISPVSAPGGESVQYNIFVTSEAGNWERGWSSDRKWTPPISNFNNINYSINAAARVFKDGVPREAPAIAGTMFVLHPDVPPPSKREPDGYWVASSQSEYDSGTPGIYARFGGTVLKTVNTVREIHHEFPFANGDIAEYAARGDYYGFTFASPDYRGFARKIDRGSEFTKGYHGATSFVVARQAPPAPPPPPPAPPPPPPSSTQFDTTGQSGTPASSGAIEALTLRVANLETRIGALERKIGTLPSDTTTPTIPPGGEVALFYISSEPQRATITLDGRSLRDYTPANVRYEVTPGAHEIRLKKGGYKEYVENVTLAAGDIYSKVVRLEPL